MRQKNSPQNLAHPGRTVWTERRSDCAFFRWVAVRMQVTTWHTEICYENLNYPCLKWTKRVIALWWFCVSVVWPKVSSWNLGGRASSRQNSLTLVNCGSQKEQLPNRVTTQNDTMKESLLHSSVSGGRQMIYDCNLSSLINCNSSHNIGLKLFHDFSKGELLKRTAETTRTIQFQLWISRKVAMNKSTWTRLQSQTFPNTRTHDPACPSPPHKSLNRT